MTPEEKERRESLAASAAEGAAWVKKLKLLRDGYLSGAADRSREAERRLLAIREPIAVGPVLRVLVDEANPALRLVGLRVLGSIPGPEASAALVGRLLIEEEDDVRQATIDELSRRDESEVVPSLTRALRSTHHEVVNRSAFGLAHLNAVRVVPKLVPALITIEQEVVMVPASGGGTGIGFNATAPSGGIGYGGQNILVPTTPVVGPNAVGIGATSVPYGSGVGLGGSPMSAGRGPTPRLVPVEYRNDQVLAALIKMTGRDFGFDILTWNRWIATSFKIDAPPTRRVPQP